MDSDLSRNFRDLRPIRLSVVARANACGYTLLNAAYYGVPQMRERLFLIGYRREIANGVTFPEPTHWVDLPPGYEGSRAVALKLLRGTDAPQEAFDYIPPPEASEHLPPAPTAVGGDRRSASHRCAGAASLRGVETRGAGSMARPSAPSCDAREVTSSSASISTRALTANSPVSVFSSRRPAKIETTWIRLCAPIPWS